ncbi:MAG: DMT family transporter [Planctomycetes bacterium]|nr:DMT family transporter [Planctomycetota bacterium]
MPPTLCVLLAGAMFASGGALLKSCDFPSLQRAGLRAAIAALTLFVLLPAARRKPDARVLRLVLPYFGATALFVIANSLTTAANAIFLQSTAPLWILLFAPLLLRERPTRRDVVVFGGVAAGMTLCFLAPTEVQRTAPNPALGDLFALASGVCFALLLLGLRWLARSDDDASAAALAWGNALALPLAFALMPFAGQSPIRGSASDWVVITVLGVFQVGLAYVVLTAGLRQVPAVRASLLLMLEPALNPLIAYAVHGERPAPLAVAGGALIVGSVGAASVLARQRRGQ